MAVTLTQLFQDETYAAILQRMLDRIPSDIDKSEGSYIWDAEAPVAYEYAKQAAFFKFVVEQAFALLASGEYLDKMAADFGISRAPAVPATVELLLTGNPGGEIPAGTRAAVQGTSIMFATDKDAVIGIGGTVSVAATCTTAGESGNVPNGVVTLMVDYVAPVATVGNPTPATGGVDAEDDNTLKNRILFFKRNPERGGTTTDYQRWAFTVAGVVSAHCVDLARGIGSVDVILGAPPDILDSLVTLVQAVVDLKKPLGVHPLVKKATILPVVFRITVSGISALVAEDAAMSYLNTISISGKVKFSWITRAIINAGASDAYITSPTGAGLSLPEDTMIDPSIYITIV